MSTNHNPNKWNDLSITKRISIMSAIAAFTIGWVLSICGFVVPPLGEVADSVLWILGQSLVYAASVFGVTSYFASESAKLRHDMDKHVAHLESMSLQREKLRNNQEVVEMPNEYEE